MMNAIRMLFSATVLAMVCMQAHAYDSFTGPKGLEYQIHYSAVPTTFLSAEIAKENDILRSKGRGLLNMHVIRVNPDASQQTVVAYIKGRAEMFDGTQQDLSFEQSIDDDFISYLSQFTYREGRIMTFRVAAYPPGIAEPFVIQFSKTLYHE